MGPILARLNKPRPAAPSSRVYAAFAIAAIIGVATFLIWWITSDVRRFGFGGTPPATTAVTPPKVDAPIETALPRGGTLTGSTDDMDLAARGLTGAPLVRVNRSTDQIEPWLAQSWTASPDNLIYTLTLRPGLMAADGTALTATGVVKAMGTIFVINTPLAIRAIDPLTVEIRFAAPFAPALRMLDDVAIDGFGPFVGTPAAKRPGPRRFKRNPHYWRKAADGSALPYLDEIVLTASPARPSGDFDEAAIRAEDFEALKKLEQSGKLRVYELGPGLDADALWFSPLADVSRRNADGAKADRPWLFDERFRLAISTAVDRREYCKQVFYGACDPMAGPVSPANVRWFNPDFPLGPGNPELARKMLEEQGLRDRDGDALLEDATRRPLRFILLIRRDVSASARAAQFLAATLKAIGVQMDVTPVSAEALAARRKTGAYDAIYDRVETRDTDPAMNLDFWLSSGARHVWNGPTRTPADWERQIDQLMLKNAGTFDRIERLQAFIDAQKLYLQHMPAMFFGTPRVRIATSMRTLNATPSPLKPHLLWNAEHLATFSSAPSAP